VEETMLILVPFKPIAIVLGCLSALILGSYFVSCWMEHKSPFLTYHPTQIRETTTVAHPVPQHRHPYKATPQVSQ
jgi:hypothetical protein